MVTGVPTGPPLGGEKSLMIGCPDPVTVKFVGLKAAPRGPLTVMRPVVALSGTVVVIRPSFEMLNVASTFLNSTLGIGVKPLPEIVTGCPTAPASGETDVMLGRVAVVTVKLTGLVLLKLGLLTTICPDVAPAGTKTLMFESSTTS